MKSTPKLALLALAAIPLVACSSTPVTTTAPPATSAPASAPATSAPASSAPASNSSTAGTASYTLAEVAKHNTQQDCWAAIDGSVYNLTDWISQHPGGADKIIPLCGTDATAAFRGQHNTQAQPNQMLATFKVGELTD